MQAIVHIDSIDEHTPRTPLDKDSLRVIGRHKIFLLKERKQFFIEFCWGLSEAIDCLVKFQYFALKTGDTMEGVDDFIGIIELARKEGQLNITLEDMPRVGCC